MEADAEMADNMTRRPTSLWARAEAMAQATPPERNRYVDFLRALSILAVVVGHWLVAAPYMEGDRVVGGHLLGILPWTQWLTWGFQVMPLFFLVGGYSNAMSWAANRRDGKSYADWFTGRMQRLVNPVMPLFLVWAVTVMVATLAGIDRDIVRMASELALIPVWFLAVYLLIASLVPFSFAAWQRMGMASFWLLVAGAAIVDVLTLHFHVRVLNFINFLFVWLAIHQLGYAWQAGRFANPMVAMGWGISGLLALLALVHFGPYPVAMIGVPGEALSNSMPPTLALLTLGIAQTGFALALEPAMRRLLARPRLWTGVVLVNGMIMTIYLWHLTAFVLVMIAAWALGGFGLHVVPGTATWWLERPLWFATYIAALLPLIALFARYEQAGRAVPTSGRALPMSRLITGMLLISAGLAATAAFSIASPLGITGVRLWIVALPFIGAAFLRFGPAYDLARRAT